MTIKELQNIIANNGTTLNSIHAGECVGIWIDNGIAYIDKSERIARLSDAIKIGVERKQKSIFDWCVNRCIGLED